MIKYLIKYKFNNNKHTTYVVSASSSIIKEFIFNNYKNNNLYCS